MIEAIKKTLALLSKRDKRIIYLLAIASILVSLVETLAVAIIMPYIQLASDFSFISTNSYLNYVYNSMGFSSEYIFVVACGGLLILFYIARSFINIIYQFYMVKFSQTRYHHFACALFSNYMLMPYTSYTNKNTSHLSKTIITEANNFIGILSNLLIMLSEAFVFIAIYSMMIYTNWKMSLLITILILINIIFLYFSVSRPIKKSGTSREKYQSVFFKVLNDSLSNFKSLKLKSNNQEIEKNFSNASFEYAKANINFNILSQIPRIFLEFLSFSIVLFMVIYLVYKYQSDISSSIALITLFVVSLYRMMPSLNRIISSYNGIVFNYRAIEILDNELNETIENLGDKIINFEKEIFIDNIYFSYYKEPSINNINNLILSNISLKIKKNQKIAFIGESGSGKSTLVDIISGFHTPNDGNIKVDGIIINMDNLKSWRQKIGYVPQQIYLFDGNIANNIALSNTYDEDRIKEVLKQANILDFLEKEQEGILTQVGESGIKLSGGQKQRIGIARALYSNPELLVLDEATSALDEATEKVIMEEIYQIAKNKTLIIIAHRLSTIKKCDIVYRVSRNKIVKELS